MPPGAAARREIRQGQRIGRDVVAVEPLQRVGVEEQRGHGADRQGNEGRIAKQPVAERQPHHERHEGDRQLGHDAGGRHGDAVTALHEAGGRRGIDIRHGHQHHQRDAGLVHLPAPTAHRHAVRGFVNQLDRHVEQQRQHREARRGHPALGVGPKRRAMLRCQHDQRQYAQQPHAEGSAREQEALQRLQPIEPGGRVGQPHAPRQQVAAAAFRRHALQVRHEHGNVGRVVELDQRRFAQPRDHVDQLVLCGRLVRVGELRFPELLHRARAVETADHRIGRRVEAHAAAARRVGEQVPGVAAHLLAAQAHAWRDARRERGHAVPAGTVETGHEERRERSTPMLAAPMAAAPNSKVAAQTLCTQTATADALAVALAVAPAVALAAFDALSERVSPTPTKPTRPRAAGRVHGRPMTRAAAGDRPPHRRGRAGPGATRRVVIRAAPRLRTRCGLPRPWR